MNQEERPHGDMRSLLRALGMGGCRQRRSEWPPAVAAVRSLREVGVPGNPLPPGQRGLPPPGHRVNRAGMGATARRRRTGRLGPVEWNSEVNAWGVQWNGGFRTAPF